MPENVEHWPLDRFRPYERNARTHSPEQIAQISASIVEFGWTNPILASIDGMVIAGHGRLEAAKRLGLATAPVILANHLSEAQRRAYVIADNKLALNAGWDEELLRAELAALDGAGFELPLLGFSDDELGPLLGDGSAGASDADPEETPEPQPDPVSRLGDVWLLGGHRIVCGDSTDANVVGSALAGAKPHLMVTDPPYGVEYDPKWRGEAKSSDGKRVSLGVHAVGQVLNDHRADWREAWALFPGDVAYVWHAGLFAPTVAESLAACGFKLRSQIIWAKNNFAIGRGDYHGHHEPCWYAVKGTGHWAGDRKQSTLWAIPKPQKSETGHGTQKPVECMKRPIENNSERGDAIYEPFSGSGTTVIAGEMTGRRVHAIELNPAYVDVAVLRWIKFAGKDAVLEETGETFEAVERRRNAAAA